MKRKRSSQILSILLILTLCLSLWACGNGAASTPKTSQQATQSDDPLTDDQIKKVLLSDSWVDVWGNKSTTYQFYGGGVGNLKIKGFNGIAPKLDWEIKDGYIVVNATSDYQNTSVSFFMKEVGDIYRLQTDMDTDGTHYFVREKDFDTVVEQEGIEFTEPEPATITETEHCSLDGIYVDRSYVNKKNSSLKKVYICYDVFTKSENLKVSAKLSHLTFESGNTYSSEHFSKSCTDYMPNFYSSDYLKDVYVGESLKVVSAFQVPDGEFESGEFLTIEPYGLPSGEKLVVKYEDIQFFDDPGALAQAADPDGYEEVVQKHEPADQQTVSKVKAAINGYYWTFYVNSTSYKIEFFSPNRFELQAMGIKNGGTYTVQNGFVVITYDSNGTSVDIPYSFGPDDIVLELADAFDVRG